MTRFPAIPTGLRAREQTFAPESRIPSRSADLGTPDFPLSLDRIGIRLAATGPGPGSTAREQSPKATAGE